MDINTLRVILLVLGFVLFTGIIWWAYGSKRKARFDEAARLPFNENNLTGKTFADNMTDTSSPNDNTCTKISTTEA